MHLNKVTIERGVTPGISQNGQIWKVPDTADTFMDHMVITSALSQVALSSNYDFWGGRSLTIFNVSDGKVKIFGSGEPGIYVPGNGCIHLECISSTGALAIWGVLGISENTFIAFPVP